ncbi:a5f8bc1e-453e-4dd4-9896-ef81ee09151a-CDS [Sclerotinia trifoliorum]|uniref:A5f8bc1e-453e-4dd4-9896-ef81ee09151a-CDS n=1 Tax=Sclerotinia trifoliorum TaxID=28548 RepID=A0A8H2ZSY5_9HELO|nr:a5f8bc1e-453e-4dd4-9896-ef81ee09151a-CDS [Sclerotinia trifoliorum]
MDIWPPIIDQHTLTFTIPDLTESQRNLPPIPCSICSTGKRQGYICTCTIHAYYCSTDCRGTHQITCISTINKRMPRPLPTFKLAFYFPPERTSFAICWIPCPTVVPASCVPSCNECIVCQACHDCHAYDVPLPTSILALGANSTTATMQNNVEKWALVPGISDPEDWTLSVIHGVKEGEILGTCSKSLSIEIFTGCSRDWRGPFIMMGALWSDCEGKVQSRDVTGADLQTARKFFVSTTRSELGLVGVADDERREQGVLEMNDLLGGVLKGR